MNLGFDPNTVDRVQLAKVLHGDQVERDYADVEKKFLLRPEKECRPTEVENGKKPDGKLRNDDRKEHADDARKASST